MKTSDIAPTLVSLFGELTEGAHREGEAFILNSGDAGLLASLDKLDASQWSEIRSGLRAECVRWRETLGTSRDVSGLELSGMVGSIAHLAYHLGAIRQIDRSVRGPREGTFKSRQ